jgi:hypothetical protein
MQRLAALVPRPRLHLIRYHGVLARNATLRAHTRMRPNGRLRVQVGRSLAATDASPTVCGHVHGPML